MGLAFSEPMKYINASNAMVKDLRPPWARLIFRWRKTWRGSNVFTDFCHMTPEIDAGNHVQHRTLINAKSSRFPLMPGAREIRREAQRSLKRARTILWF